MISEDELLLGGDGDEVEMATGTLDLLDGSGDGETSSEHHAELLEEISSNIILIRKSVSEQTPHYIKIALRNFRVIRPKLTSEVLREVIQSCYMYAPVSKSVLLTLLQEGGDDDIANVVRDTGVILELDYYVSLLVLTHLIDKKIYKRALTCAESLIRHVCSYKSSVTVLPYFAHCYYFYVRAHELNGNLAKIRSPLLNLYQRAILCKDIEGQTVLICSILRSFLSENEYDQASRFMHKARFPENAPSNQIARYCYYKGFIHVVQLDYSNAKDALINALHKSPEIGAIGFKQSVNKLLITVDLLMGNIPERHIFYEKFLRRPLFPYFQLTEAMYHGSVMQFDRALEKHSTQFRKDKTYKIILRIRHNVMKAGLHKIGKSYQKISFYDIGERIGIDCVTNVEYIVCKAIRDGVIQGVINHTGGYLTFSDPRDIYSTSEPQKVYDARIRYNQSMYKQITQAMTYTDESSGYVSKTAVVNKPYLI